MSIRDRIWKGALMVLGLIASFSFAVTKNPQWLFWATDGDYRYGDLYGLAKVRRFRPAQPLPGGAYAQRDSLDLGRSPRRDDVVFLGDSFGFRDDGESPFWMQLGQGTGKSVFSIYYNHHFEIWSHPYEFLQKIGASQTHGILVYELVERLIPPVFREPIGSKAPSLPPDKLQSPGVDFFQHTAERHQIFFKHSFLTGPFVTGWNTILFETLRRISRETPLYSVSPPFLFYCDDVECFRSPHSEESVFTMADNIASLARTLRQQYHRQLLFVPIPNKITIYSRLATQEPYDEFLPRLYRALRDRQVPVVETLQRFRAEKELLFWPTDTHWNAAGIRIAVEETLKLWPEKPASGD